MKLDDLRYCKNIPTEHTLNDEGKFIYQYGSFNCRFLKFKSADEILKIMIAYDPGCITEKELKFINKNQEKSVLAYIHNRHGNDCDIFVYGDDNVAFQLGCFQ